jgi:hypothetical protein
LGRRERLAQHEELAPVDGELDAGLEPAVGEAVRHERIRLLRVLGAHPVEAFGELHGLHASMSTVVHRIRVHTRHAPLEQDTPCISTP